MTEAFDPSKWIHNSKINAPEDPDAIVRVRLRNGSEQGGRAAAFEWELGDINHDITHFQYMDRPMPKPKPTANTRAEEPMEVTPPEAGGTKHDQDKPRMDLLDPHAIEVLAQVLTFGAKKYEAHNWRKGISKGRLLAAALRHLFAYLGGQDKDPETGLSHVGHAMCCCMFLLGLENRMDLDDRYKP